MGRPEVGAELEGSQKRAGTAWKDTGRQEGRLSAMV